MFASYLNRNVCLVFGLFVLATLFVNYWEASLIGLNIDRGLLVAVNQGLSHPWLDHFFIWISARGTFSIPLLFLILAILVVQHGVKGLKLWGLLILAIGLGDQLGNLLKGLFSEPRPCATVFDLINQPGSDHDGASCGAYTTGMPSNHALNFFLTAAFLGATLKSRRWAVPFFVIAGLAGISRVYLGVHYPSQVMFGALLGAMVGVFAAHYAGMLHFMKSIHDKQTGPGNGNHFNPIHRWIRR